MHRYCAISTRCPRRRSRCASSALFGEAGPVALQQAADATGGEVFDARKAQLSEVFEEIRGYQ